MRTFVVYSIAILEYLTNTLEHNTGTLRDPSTNTCWVSPSCLRYAEHRSAIFSKSSTTQENEYHDAYLDLTFTADLMRFGQLKTVNETES